MFECLLCQCEKFSGIYGLIFVVVSIRKHMHNIILSMILSFVHPMVMVRQNMLELLNMVHYLG